MNHSTLQYQIHFNFVEKLTQTKKLQLYHNCQLLISLQDEIYREMVRKEEKIKTKKGIHNAEDVTLLCKECSKYITKASFIRTKGCHYTCVDPNIKERIRIVDQRRRAFRTTVNTGN